MTGNIREDLETFVLTAKVLGFMLVADANPKWGMRWLVNKAFESFEIDDDNLKTLILEEIEKANL